MESQENKVNANSKFTKKRQLIFYLKYPEFSKNLYLLIGLAKL